MIPEEIKKALDNNAVLIFSISGGKDSDAMMYHLMDLREKYGWQGEVVAVHADLGEMEHPESLPHCQNVCRKLGIELVVLETDLLAGFDARRQRLDEQGKVDTPHWSSSAARYCTSDFKRNPINVWLRNRWESDAAIVMAQGLRAGESTARAKKDVFRLRPNCQAPTKARVVWDWNPIHSWSTEDVWQRIGYTMNELHSLQANYLLQYHTDSPIARLLVRKMEYEFKAHLAYLRGNQRVSCIFCVLASPNDWATGAQHNPMHYRRLCQRELDTGFSYHAKRWLCDVRPDLLSKDQREQLAELRGLKEEKPKQLDMFEGIS